MFPDFFQNKMKEVKSFFKIMRGKVKGNDQERIKGVDEALTNLEKERKIYEEERLNALGGIDPDTKRYQEPGEEKVLKQSGGQDISAI